MTLPKLRAQTCYTDTSSHFPLVSEIYAQPLPSLASCWSWLGDGQHRQPKSPVSFLSAPVIRARWLLNAVLSQSNLKAQLCGERRGSAATFCSCLPLSVSSSAHRRHASLNLNPVTGLVIQECSCFRSEKLWCCLSRMKLHPMSLEASTGTWADQMFPSSSELIVQLHHEQSWRRAWIAQSVEVQVPVQAILV